MSKIVSAPLVIAKDDAGRDLYLYQGSPVPENLGEGEADRLADYFEDAGAESKAAKKSSK